MAITVPEEISTLYRERHRSIDCVLDAVENGPVGLIRGGSELVALTKHSEFCTDFMRPFETADRIDFLDSILPHLQQALRTQHQFVELSCSGEGVTAVIDTIRHGIVLVDANHTVVQINSAAERILTADDGLYLRSGRIQTSRGSMSDPLRISIGRACNAQASGVCEGDSLMCTRPSGKRPYIIYVLPLTDIGRHGLVARHRQDWHAAHLRQDRYAPTSRARSPAAGHHTVDAVINSGRDTTQPTITQRRIRGASGLLELDEVVRHDREGATGGSQPRGGRQVAEFGFGA